MIGKPLTILHVLAPADVGGLETVVRALALGHAAMGHTVEIAAVLDSSTNPFVDEARAAGLTVNVIASPARSVRPERRGVRAILDRRRFDVLHSHGYRSDILNLGIARDMGVPSVTTLHGFSATDRKARAYEWLQLRAARRASAIVAVSTNVAARIAASGASPRLVHLIRNALSPGVAMDRDRARECLSLDAGPQLGWIGRLSAEKGPDVMLHAMQYLTDIPLTASFIGDGPDKATLVKNAALLGVADRVRFHGRVTDAATLIRAFDVLVLSSRTEGTPMVILEGMASQVPIVACRVGGIPDMLSADDALLVAPDDPRALASAIRETLGDMPASRARARHAHERLLAEFSNEAWLAQYESLYRAIQTPDSTRRS